MTRSKQFLLYFLWSLLLHICFAPDGLALKNLKSLDKHTGRGHFADIVAHYAQQKDVSINEVTLLVLGDCQLFADRYETSKGSQGFPDLSLIIHKNLIPRGDLRLAINAKEVQQSIDELIKLPRPLVIYLSARSVVLGTTYDPFALLRPHLLFLIIEEWPVTLPYAAVKLIDTPEKAAKAKIIQDHWVVDRFLVENRPTTNKQSLGFRSPAQNTATVKITHIQQAHFTFTRRCPIPCIEKYTEGHFAVRIVKKSAM